MAKKGEERGDVRRQLLCRNGIKENENEEKLKKMSK
jgi:hypothetical protein